MVITSVGMKMLDKENTIVATAIVGFDNLIVVRDFRIINGPYGLFLSMPSRKLKNGSYTDVFHPLKPQARTALNDLIVACSNYCAENEYDRLNFILKEDFSGDLYSQTISDFYTEEQN